MDKIESDFITDAAYLSTLDGGLVHTIIQSDNGDFLGMTNGRVLIDQTQKISPNGTGINMTGGFIRQNYLVAPDLQGNNSLLLFTISCDSGNKIAPPCKIYVSRIQINPNTKQVDIDPSFKNKLLTAVDCYPILDIIPGSCNEYWVVTYSRDVKQFLAYKISDKGISADPVSSMYNMELFNPSNRLGYKMRFVQETNKLYLNTGVYKVLEFDFNRNTGKVEYNRIVVDYLSSNKIITDFEVALEGKFLYTIADSSFSNSNIKTTELWQIPIDTTEESNIYKFSTNSFSQDMVSLGLGPDQKIYIGSKANGISRLESPDISGQDARFIFNIFPSTTNFNLNYGFPKYINYVRFNELPNPFPKKIALCEGAPYTVSWDDNNLQVAVNNQKIEGNTYTFRDTGSFSVIGEKDGCIFSDITRVSYEDVINLNLDREVEFCGESVTIGPDSTSSLLSFTWSTGESSPRIEVTNEGTYFLDAKSESGCFIKDTVTVIKSDPPEVDLGMDRSVCNGSSLVLDAGVEADSYLWQDGSTNRELVVSEPGEYSVMVTFGSCTNSDSVTISSAQGFTISLEPEAEFCSGDSIVIGGGLDPSYAYTWSTGESTQEITITNGGTYSVTANNGQCESSAQITIMELTSPRLDLGPDQEYCKLEGFITLENLYDQSDYSYLWDDGSTEASRLVNSTGIYSVVASNDYCMIQDEVAIDVDPNLCDCRVTFPNAVNKTSVSSFVNLDFLPSCAKQNFIYTIYDRWGNRILEYKNGHKPSEEQVASINSGVYVYVYSNDTDYIVPEYGTIVFVN